MALTDALPGPSGLTDSIEAGKDLAALLASNPDGTPRAGILAGPLSGLVTGRSDLRVDIAPFKAALVRNGAVRLIANDAPEQSPYFTVPDANSRIDILYVKVGEHALVEAETDGPFFGILQGVAAPIPSKPTLNIDGALELATVKLTSTDTGTAAANAIAQTAQRTVAAGGIVPLVAAGVGAVAAAPSAGITVNTTTWVTRDSRNVVEAYIDLTRSSALPSPGAPIAIMAGGFRPQATLPFTATVSEGGVAGATFGQIEPSGNITVFNPGAGNRRATLLVKYPAAT